MKMEKEKSVIVKFYVFFWRHIKMVRFSDRRKRDAMMSWKGIVEENNSRKSRILHKGAKGLVL